MVLADSHAARLFVFGRGQTNRTETVVGEKINHSSVGGWSQMRYQRHTEKLQAHHARELVKSLERLLEANSRRRRSFEPRATVSSSWQSRTAEFVARLAHPLLLCGPGREPIHMRQRPLRIAIVAASLRILGGQAVQAQRLLDGWKGDSEIDAWLVPIDPVPTPPCDALLSVKYARTVVTQLWYWPLLARELRRADVVHVFSASYLSFLLAPLPAIIIARMLGRPVVLNYHSGEAPDHLRRSALARHVMRGWVDLNVVPSAFLRDVLASFGIPARTVPNTIDPRQFAYRVRDPLRPRILSTRNFEPMYNVAAVLRAFARVQARRADATLTLVGSGSQEPALRALATQLDLRHVTFAGRVPPSGINRYYAEADIYVQTPAIDNMPLSMLEAFASGLPVVSTGVGGVPAILTHGVHGLLAPADDDEAVAAHVMTLLESHAYARQLAAAARETCAGYEWPVAREGWLAAYRSVAKDSSWTASAQSI